MSYLEIKNFKAGLERRQSELTSQPGALFIGENGHITQGGEFEKRKAFVLQGTLPRAITLAAPTVNGDTNGDTLNSYGLQSTAAGLLTFGSSDAARNVSATGVPYPFPTGVTYQRLRHHLIMQEGVVVNVDDGTTTNFTLGSVVRPAMTGVTTSCAFNGKAYVVSTFGTGAFGMIASNQMHYDGSPVNQFWYGNIWFTNAAYGIFSVFDLYFDAAQEVPGFSPKQLLDANNSVLFYGPTDATMVLTASDTDSTSSLTVSNSIPTSGAVAAVSAKTHFDITVWATGTRTITITDLGGTVTVCPATAASAGVSITTFVIAVVRAINSSGTGYTAAWSTIVNGTALNYRINIFAPASLGNTTSTLTVTVSAGTGTITPTAPGAFAGGVDAITGNSAPAKASFGSGQWTLSSHWTLVITSQGISYTLGAGNIFGTSPTFCIAVGNKVYFVSGNNYYFSSILDATKWEDQDTGAGKVQVRDRFADPQSLVALATYQGKLAVFSRWSVQIWTIDADPTLYTQGQTLQNIGTLAAASVQAVGDLDVLFLSDTGVRSLRVRDASNNAIISDVGSPIDQLIQDNLIVGASNSSACGIVEPLTNRYWLFLNNIIYVFSYYPTNKVLAWSTYLPQYDVVGAPLSGGTTYGGSSHLTSATLVVGQLYLATFGAHEVSLTVGTATITATGYFVAVATSETWTGTAPAASFTGSIVPVTQTTFTPEKFLVHNGRVYVLATDGKVFLYGGAANLSFDSAVATAELPYMAAGKPGTFKTSTGLDAVLAGAWSLYGCMSPSDGTMAKIADKGTVGTNNVRVDSTVEDQRIMWSARGTHVKLKAVTRIVPGQTPFYNAKLSSLIWHYREDGEK